MMLFSGVYKVIKPAVVTLLSKAIAEAFNANFLQDSLHFKSDERFFARKRLRPKISDTFRKIIASKSVSDSSI